MPRTLQSEIELFKGLDLQMQHWLSTHGYHPSFSDLDTCELTPHFDKMRFLVWKWIIAVVALGEDDGVTNAQLTEVISRRTGVGTYKRLFTYLPYEMAMVGVIRTWKERRPNKAGVNQLQRIWGRI
jgi:hypothetical protein